MATSGTTAFNLAIDEIVEEIAAANYSMRKLIHLITQSAPFVTASNPDRKKSLEK